jgi:thioredoxin-related protein
MKKLFISVALIVLAAGVIIVRHNTIKTREARHLYNPAADAKAEIADAVNRASEEHKNVLLQIGGNWCKWCLSFNDLVTNDQVLNKCLHDNYVVVHVNYSKENMNEKVLAELGYPQRLGFPVFVVLDDKGNRLYTQNSGGLADGKSHSKEKILRFFKYWSPKALDPKNYEKAK